MIYRVLAGLGPNDGMIIFLPPKWEKMHSSVRACPVLENHGGSWVAFTSYGCHTPYDVRRLAVPTPGYPPRWEWRDVEIWTEAEISAGSGI